MTNNWGYDYRTLVLENLDKNPCPVLSQRLGSACQENLNQGVILFWLRSNLRDVPDNSLEITLIDKFKGN